IGRSRSGRFSPVAGQWQDRGGTPQRRNSSMSRRSAIIAVLASLVLALSLSSAVLAGSGNRAGVFRIALTGAQEIGGGDPDASARASMIAIPATVTVCDLAECPGIEDTLSRLEIHAAPAGVNGGVVVPLFVNASFGSTGKT